MKKFLAILLLLTTLISQGWGDTEPNDSCAQGETWATLSISSTSSTMGGSVSSGNDDYYKIVVSDAGSLTITGSANQNTNFYLLNSACAELDNHTNTKAPSITYTVTSGTYYLRINRNGNSTYSNMKASLNYATSERDFSLRDAHNLRGDVSVIGNTVLCVNNNGACQNYTGTSSNADLDLIYIDVDGVNRTYNNSSQAFLSIPSTAVIKWAAIYSQGYLNGTNLTTIGNTIKTPIYLSVPTVGTIASTPEVFDLLANGTDGYTYDTYAPLNSLIGKTGAQINGWITGGNIKADTGVENSGLGNYGAWALVVVYEDPNLSLKNISTFDGYKKVANQTGFKIVDVLVGGFKTPLNGDVFSNLSLFAGEGDANIAGDKLYVNGIAINDVNAFNSSLMGVTANPSFTNNQGIDIQTHQIGKDGNTSHKQIIGTNESSATIRFTTTGDTYFPSLVVFSTEIYSPTIGNFDKNVSISYASNQTCGTGKDLRGATLNYEMSFQNTGTEHAETVRVYDNFQSNGILDYLDMTQTTIPVAQLISGTASPSVTCDKNATSVYCDFSRINQNTKYKITFATKVKTTIILTDDIDLSNTANAHYYNAATHEEITQLASSNMQVAGGICALLPVADYRLDECSVSGVQGDVVDSSGNNLNGMTVNSPFKVSGQICTGNKFSRNTYSNVTIPHDPLLSQLNELTITTWINPVTIPSSDLYTIASKDTNYEFHLDTAGKVFWWWGNGSFTGASSVPVNSWTHITLTYKSGEQKIYINGVEDASATYTGTLPQNTLPFYIGVDYNYPSRTFDGAIDEVKIFDRSLSPSEILKIYTNELSNNNFNGAERTCPDCVIIPDPAVTFDAWDTFRSISDRNISTKIVSKPFDLNISSLNETNDGFQDFNGTLCARLIDTAGASLTDWVKLTYASEQTKTATFTLSRAIGGSDSAGVRLMWEKNAPSATACDALTNTGTIIASDRFSVRPLSFTLPSASGIAGVDFNITFTAPNFTGTASTAYNESAGGSFEVSVAEHNPLCTLGTFNPIPNSFSFVNGTKLFTTRYSEVGVLDVNITDLTKACNARYANVDCDDADVSGFYTSASDLPIGLTQGQITVKAHHFDVTGTLTNFSGGNFTYLSDDLNMSAALDLNITAKNGEGNTTANYSSACYAKNTDLTLVHSTIPSPLTKILYSETLTALNTNVLNTDPWVLSLNSGLFNSGSVLPNIDFNFDRSPGKPLNPFDFNITSATATDADSVSGTGTPLGDATFVYGRARAFDVTTNEASAPNPIEFEVYSTTSSGFVSGMPQNVLKWYRNLNHDTAANGNVIRGGYSAGGDDIDASATPTDGLQIVTVTSVHDQTIHLDISKWLWYSPNYTYDYSGNCTRHPCFNYDYTDASLGVKGVNSGTFQGSDFQMTPAKNITNKGVKLFR